MILKFLNFLFNELLKGLKNFLGIRKYLVSYFRIAYRHWQDFGFFHLARFFEETIKSVFVYLSLWTFTLGMITWFSYELVESIASCLYSLGDYMKTDFMPPSGEKVESDYEVSSKPNAELEKPAEEKKVEPAAANLRILHKRFVVVALLACLLIWSGWLGSPPSKWP